MTESPDVFFAPYFSSWLPSSYRSLKNLRDCHVAYAVNVWWWATPRLLSHSRKLKETPELQFYNGAADWLVCQSVQFKLTYISTHLISMQFSRSFELIINRSWFSKKPEESPKHNSMLSWLICVPITLSSKEKQCIILCSHSYKVIERLYTL
jgi:hypothetical protein